MGKKKLLRLCGFFCKIVFYHYIITIGVHVHYFLLSRGDDDDDDYDAATAAATARNLLDHLSRFIHRFALLPTTAGSTITVVIVIITL